MRFLILFLAVSVMAQETEVNGSLAVRGVVRAISGSTSGLDMSSAAFSRPFREVGTTPSGACTLTDGVRFDTGSRTIYVCGAGNTWTQIIGGGGGAVSSVFGRTGGVTAQAGDYSAFYPQLASTYSDPGWIVSLAWGKLTGVPSTFTPSAHNHAGTEITTGQIAAARLGTGTANSSSYLRGDGAWTVPPFESALTFDPVMTRSGNTISWTTCADGQIRKMVSGTWTCAADATATGSGYGTIQVGGTSLTQRATLDIVPGFGFLAAGTDNGTKTLLTLTAEAGPFPFASLPAASANSGRAVIVTDASNCTSSAATVAGSGTQSCLVRSNGTNWLTPTGGAAGALVAANNLSDLASAATARTNLGLGNSATLNTGTTAGTVATGDHTHANGGYYFASQGRTGDITPTVNTWTDLYSIANVPALAAGACYQIQTAMGGTDSTVNSYDNRVVMGTGGTQVLVWTGVNPKYLLSKFMICNDPGTQTAQTINDLSSGYNQNNSSLAGVTPYFPVGTHSATSANFSAPFTLTVQVRTATAAQTFRGFFVRISQ